MKKIIAFALAVLMVVPMMMFSASAETVTADKSWYDDSKTEFTVTTAAQLYGFAQLSLTKTFEGKTVKLGADITVNEGDAATWGTTPPANHWTPIKNFKGTFDGQGYTVSGLYAKGSNDIGMFTGTAAECLIQDFSLVNSYIETVGTYAAGVSAAGGGTFKYIYSDAIIVCGDHHCGGIFGVSTKPTVIDTCWFDGTVTLTKRYGAGILGNGNNQNVEIRNCLNSGSVFTTHAEGNAHIGGMCGRNDASTIIENCLNVGKISSQLTEGGSDDQLGSIFGQCSANNKNDDGTWKSHTSIIKSWASLESAPKAHASLSSKDPAQIHDANVISENLLKGYSAYATTTLDFENVWCVDLDSYPKLQYFTPAEEIPPLYILSTPTVENTEMKLEGHYGPRWTVKLTLPEGWSKEDIDLGALVMPTAAIPADRSLTLLDTEFEYRGNKYEVANVEAKILRESGENEIIATFVVTDLDASNIRQSYTLVPYANFNIEGADPVAMYGDAFALQYYQQTLLDYEAADDAYKAQADAILAPIEKEMGGRMPVDEAFLGYAEFAEIPAMIVADTTVVPVTDFGPANEDTGARYYTVKVDGTLDADYYAYLELLEQFGFEKIYDNGEKGIEDVVYTAMFKKGDLVVTVVDMCYLNQTHIQAAYDLPVSEHLFDNFSDDVIEGAVTSLHNRQIWYWGNNIIIQLKNGHFILNDGATDYELPYLLDYLETLVPEGEIPVVDAWFFSHQHYDHSCVVRPFVDNPEWIDRIRVNGFYVNEPADVVKDMDPGVYNEIAKSRLAMSMLKDENGNTPAIYRPTTGQRLYFSDIEIEIILSQEQVDPATYTGGYNDCSTWLRYWIEGQNVVIGGDAHNASMQVLMWTYDPEMLDFDVFYQLHHGGNTWDEFTEYCTFTTVICPSRSRYTNQVNLNLYEKARDNGGEVMDEANGNIVLTFPYEVGTWKSLGDTDWIYNKGQARP